MDIVRRAMASLEVLGPAYRNRRTAGLAIALGFLGTAHSAPNVLLIIGDDMGVETVAIGKWHLADADNGWQDHATRIGFDYFTGGLTGGPESYFAWTEVVDGEVTADYAMRDERYKLMRFDGVEEFYDLQADPYEHHNLLAGELSAEEHAAYGRLKKDIENLRGSR